MGRQTMRRSMLPSENDQLLSIQPCSGPQTLPGIIMEVNSHLLVGTWPSKGPFLLRFQGVHVLNDRQQRKLILII